MHPTFKSHRKDEPVKFSVAVIFTSTKLGSSASVLRNMFNSRLTLPPPPFFLPPPSSEVALARGGDEALLGVTMAGFVVITAAT